MERISYVGVAGVMLAVLLWSGPSRAQAPGDATQQAAESWVAFVDGARYAESWQAASAPFRNAVPQQRWSDAVQAARAPLGPVRARAVKSRTATRTLPGAPDGDYVVFQFDTGFEKKAAAVETITVLREPDGQWRVAGYFVK